LTLSEIEALKNLKVIRSDNDILQRLLKTYYGLVIENSTYKQELDYYSALSGEHEQEIRELEKKTDYLTQQNREFEHQNRILTRSLREFVKDLKKEGLITKDDDGEFDVRI